MCGSAGGARLFRSGAKLTNEASRALILAMPMEDWRCRIYGLRKAQRSTKLLEPGFASGTRSYNDQQAYYGMISLGSTNVRDSEIAEMINKCQPLRFLRTGRGPGQAPTCGNKKKANRFWDLYSGKPETGIFIHVVLVKLSEIWVFRLLSRISTFRAATCKILPLCQTPQPKLLCLCHSYTEH